MIFNKLGLQSFKSFEKEQVIELGKKGSHFGFITGKNNVDKYLDSNGAGKSTVVDGLCWVLFGKTTRNLKASDIKNWYSKLPCFGWVTFELRGISYKLTRTWKPNTLILTTDGKKSTVEQEDIDELIGLNFKSFLYSILFSQFTPMFFDLGSTDKSEIFANILNLDSWVEHSSLAKTLSNELNSSMLNIDNQISNINGKLEQLDNISFKDEIKNWDSEHDSKLHNLQVNLDETKDKISKLTKILRTFDTKFDGQDDKLENLKKELADIKNDISEVNHRISDLIVEKRGISYKQSEINKNIDKLNALDAICPTCKQPINEKHLDTEIVILQQDINELELDLNSVVRTIEKQKVKLLSLTSIEQKEQNKIDDLQDKINQLVESERHYQNDLKEFSDKLDSLNKYLEHTEQEINPFLSKENEISDQITKLENDLEKFELDYDKINKKYNASQYWIKGFKEIRLYLISQALKEFEIEVNDCLDSLGLQGWKITFEIDKETKSKTVQKGFHVFIHSPNNDHPVKWESWSGGESQRLRLAGTLGLSNLILTRTGVSSNIEIWDEPTQYLSESGVDDLLDTLYERSRKQKKTIWIIDHRSFDYGGFDSNIVVTKNSNGSRVTYG